MLSRTAKDMWISLGMSALRDEVVADVRARFAAGDVQWSRECIDSLREPFPNNDAGHHIEGQEDDGHLSDGERPWCTDSEAIDESDGEDGDEDDLGGGGTAAACSSEAVVSAAPTDTPEELEAAEQFAKRLKTLDAIKASAEAASLRQVVWHVDREMHKLEKQHHIGSSVRQPSAALSRFLRKKRENDAAALQKARAENQKKRIAAAKVKAQLRKSALAKAVAKKKRLESAAALAALPKSFKAVDLGFTHKTGGTRAHCAKRVALIKRLKLRSPDLPEALERKFDDFAQRYAAWLGKHLKAAVGKALINEVSDVMVKLGKYLKDDKGNDQSASDGPGDPRAFLKFVRRNLERMPPDPNEIVV